MRPGAWLAVVAVVLALLAPVAGGPSHAGGDGVAELVAELSTGAPFVDPVTLGQWIRDRRPLRLLDVRDSSSFLRFSIPTAEHVPFRELPRQAPDPGAMIVVYAGAGEEATRGWLLLRRLGHADVRILDGGVAGWVDDVLSPVLPASDAEERETYERVARVSRYFGGMPRIGDPAERARATPDDAIQLLSRRGCY